MHEVIEYVIFTDRYQQPPISKSISIRKCLTNLILEYMDWVFD